METNLFFSRSRDSDAASGTQSATVGGLFWTRIRLGKAVRGPSHNLHDNDGASGVWPSPSCVLLQSCGDERIETYKRQEYKARLDWG